MIPRAPGNVSLASFASFVSVPSSPLISASTVAAVGIVAALGLASRVAVAQIPFPTAEFIATTEPVYYEGHAAYWYGNRWYYKDERGGWQHYENEPPALAERRVHAPPARHVYGHAASHAAGRPGGHGGHR